MTYIGTITKAVIACLTALAAALVSHEPTSVAQWIEVSATALAAGIVVWYVPNTVPVAKRVYNRRKPVTKA